MFTPQKKLVLLNGCFDLLHAGHIALLKTAHANACGGFVFVAIDSDKRLRETKGPARPYVCANDRKEMLLATRYVDRVYTFDTEEELVELYRVFQPDLTVKGQEYIAKPITGATYCKEIIFHASTNHRTSNLAKRIASGG